MKAIACTAYGPPEVLRIVEIAKPQPQPNEVLIRIHATSVTVADRRLRAFDIPKGFRIPARLALGIRKPRKPILGFELAGTVEAVGREVSKFKPGDEVFASTSKGFGAYAEYRCMPEDGPIAIKPANVSFAEAATFPIGALTALHYLKKTNIGPGTDILIYGASGSVGTYAVQMARHHGARITGVCSNSNAELVKSLGAERVVDYTRSDFVSQLEQYDIVLVAVDKFSFSICKQILKPEGMYLNVTRPFRTLEMIRTALTSRKKIHVGESTSETAADMAELKQLIEDGHVRSVIDRTYPLDEIVEAHRYVDLGHKKGNVAVNVL